MRIASLFLCMLGLFGCTLPCRGDNRQIWASCYKGAQSGPNQANAIAIDQEDNVYVAGAALLSSSRIGYVVIKYNPDGLKCWVQTYAGPGQNPDVATAIAVDPWGYIYVTGYSDSGVNRYDIVTIKYASNGRKMWCKRYNGPANRDDGATALGLDANGDVYITGWSWGGTTGYDFVTLKYDPLGNFQWVQRYSGPSNHTDAATAIAVDAAGDAYVTGYSDGGLSTYMDYVTVKYDPHGAQLWVQRYDAAGHDWDIPAAIALDGLGGVYVTGSSVGPNTLSDFLTLKYDTNGNTLWAARYNGTANGYDQATALAIDAYGNVFVAGSSSTTIDTFGDLLADYVVNKYDTNGNLLWTGRYTRSAATYAYPTALLPGPLGDVYVTGYSADYTTGPGNFDYTTVRFDALGNVGWSQTYTGKAQLDSLSAAMVTDSLGDIVVAGSSGTAFDRFGQLLSNCTTIKYGP